jgi:N-acyl-D-aspartate/D-glutamate deacylase
MKWLSFRLVLILLASLCSAQQFDLVIAGGRVVDPETGFDAVRNVAVNQKTVVRISSEPMQGKKILDARGLVVAPGFIDLHRHGQDMESQRVKAMDGVTTALELEIGKPDVETFLKQKSGRSLINYGTSASHVAARASAFGSPMPEGAILPKSGPATDQPANPAQLQAVEDRLRHELAAGALAIGMGIQYTPGATRLEVIQMFRLAARNGVPVFTHVRSAGRIEPGSSIESVSEVIGAAAVTGASLHIVHINSSCGADGMECLALVAGARARGLDVTTEAYPYDAGMTFINSALFNPGWQEKFGITYSDVMIPETGERLTKQRFEELHALSSAPWVIMFSNKMEWVDREIPNPLIMIASDGDKGHPRNAGTFSRVLARYVRSQGSLTLMDAVRKMSLMPAEFLERSTPAARNKGRLQEGKDADLVVFDPQTITDRSDYQHPMEPSVGVKFLVVSGTVVVNQGQIVSDVYPGEALLGPGKR